MPASEEVVVVEATGGRGGGRTRAVLRTACGTLYGFVRTVAKTAYGSIRLAEVIAKGPGSPRDLALHGHVAIKVYERSNLLAPRGAGWLENPTGELAALSDLSLDGGHAGIVRLFEVCASPRAVFAVMEYLDGAELFARVSVGGALPPSDARDVIRQLARALDFMHGKGICHRDVSLENAVLVGAAPAPAYHGAAPADTTTTTPPANNLVVKLIDLGLCGRVAGGGLPPRAPCGKRFYMAPEILSSSAHDTKVDMWAIGCVLWCLLTASPPWESAAVMYENGDPFQRIVLDGDVAGALSERGIDPEPSLIALLRGLFELDPARRLSAAGVLTHDWLAESSTTTPATDAAAAALTPTRDAAAVDGELLDAAGSVIRAPLMEGDASDGPESASAPSPSA